MREYRSFSGYLNSIFGGRVQKIAVNAGLGCPNRDGSVGTSGCIFCNNAAFNPSYAFGGGSITKQLQAGVRFFKDRGEVKGYLPYFQSFSNTYGPTDRLVSLYEEALSFPGTLGLVIASRPDCLADELMDYFERRFGCKAPDGHPFLLLELGVESTNDKTLEKINRGHDFACFERAVLNASSRGIAVGAHLILGLPGEGPEDYLEHARRLSALPLTTLKLHQLQVIKGTALARTYEEDPDSLKLMTAEEYSRIVSLFVDNLREDIVLDRFVSETPQDMVIAPAWGLKPSEFAELLKNF